MPKGSADKRGAASKPMDAVVLAGGRGSRMMPLTLDRPKSLLAAAGRPVIAPLLDALREAGARDVTVVSGHGHEALQGYLGDGTRHGLRVRHVVQPRPAGPADALRRVPLDAVPDLLPVLPADGWTHPDLVRSLLEATEPAAVRAVDGFRPRHGVPVVEAGRLTAVESPPGTGTGAGAHAAVALAGSYVLPRRLLEALPAGDYGLRPALQADLDAHGTWACIDGRRHELADLVTGEDLVELNSLLMPATEDDRQGTVHPSAVLEGSVRLGRNTTVGPGAVLQGPVALGDHCTVGAGCVLGPGTSARNHVRIDAAAVLRDCALASNVHVGAQSQVERAYLANGVRLGRRVLAAGTRAVVVGPDATVGDGAVLLDGTLGARARVTAGRTVTDVPDNGVAV